METAPYLLSKRRGQDIPIRGVIHVGALLCEEWNDYRQLGAHAVLWIEGNPKSVEESRRLLDERGVSLSQKVVQSYLSHTDGVETFYVTNLDSRNDSLMEPCTWYKDIATKEKIQVATERLDTLFSRTPFLAAHHFNTLVVDVQGAELKVLAGAGDLLNHFDFIVCEAWHDDLKEREHYANATTVTRLKDFLDIFGFEETQRNPTEEQDPFQTQAWLDILFERKDNELAS